MFVSIHSAFSQVPHLEGKIIVSITSGTIDAEVRLKNLPKTDNYTIWLNAGLNIEYFKDLEKKFNLYFETEYEPELSSEALQHYFPSNDNESRYLPKTLGLKYTGKFPVIADTSNAYDWRDWKGNIAFNGKTLRASEQSAWYPILYNKKDDVVVDKYTFALEVECTDCQAIYLNGDIPQKTQKAIFKSEIAVPLLIFAGNYEFKKADKIFVLNAELDVNKINTLKSTTQSIIEFYERTLNTPYGKPVVYISTTPVSKRNEWMFVTYPTIAVIGVDKYKLENLIDDETFQFKHKLNIKFFAHELAHYYIGTKFVPNSELRWFFLESITEYLAIKATKELLGLETYHTLIGNNIDALQDFNPLPLNIVKFSNQIDELYRYVYAPLVLLAIEKEIGEDKMYKWIKHLLNSESMKTDYAFFVKSLSTTGITEKQLKLLTEKYISGKKAKENVIERIK